LRGKTRLALAGGNLSENNLNLRLTSGAETDTLFSTLEEQMSYTTEIMREIWSDNRGDRIEVRPYRESVGAVEIRYRAKDGSIGPRIMFNTDLARLVAKAMLSCAEEIDQENA
jgi:hypothetical protein